LPKSWTDDLLRLKATYLPKDVGFATKPQLAARMIARAAAASVPFRRVAADSAYCVGDIDRDLRHLGNGYVLGVGSTLVFRSWGKKRLAAGTAAKIANTLEPSDWKRLSAGEGTKGPRLHDRRYLELADLDADEFNEARHSLWTRGLLPRRNIEDGDLAHIPTWCPAGPVIETLENVECYRWSIEDGIETATGLGLITTKQGHGTAGIAMSPSS
jgi:SRSO17 transposase